VTPRLSDCDLPHLRDAIGHLPDAALREDDPEVTAPAWAGVASARAAAIETRATERLAIL
jgi:hypothetical protein